jgi:hypothetical protein
LKSGESLISRQEKLNMFIQSIIFLNFFELISAIVVQESAKPDSSFHGLIDHVHSFRLIPGNNFSSIVPLDKRYKFPPKLFRSFSNGALQLEYETAEDGQHEESFKDFNVSYNSDINATICRQLVEIQTFQIQINDPDFTADPIILHTCTVTYGMPHHRRPISAPSILLFANERIKNLSGFPVFYFNIDGKVLDFCLCDEIQQTLNWIGENRSENYFELSSLLIVFSALIFGLIVSAARRFPKWYRRNQVHPDLQ